mmetsp:Transcript_7329/g.20043  ORF Transcript_7329/g.20043 Transcript_7329/m.20043 type:complete len:422 (-) Transcript_7329:821-2086(-)
MQQRQGLFPLADLFACPDSCVATDCIVLKTTLPQFLKKSESATPLTTLAARANCCIEADDVWLQSALHHLVQQIQCTRPLPALAACADHLRVILDGLCSCSLGLASTATSPFLKAAWMTGHRNERLGTRWSTASSFWPTATISVACRIPDSVGNDQAAGKSVELPISAAVQGATLVLAGCGVPEVWIRGHGCGHAPLSCHDGACWLPHGHLCNRTVVHVGREVLRRHAFASPRDTRRMCHSVTSHVRRGRNEKVVASAEAVWHALTFIFDLNAAHTIENCHALAVHAGVVEHLRLPAATAAHHTLGPMLPSHLRLLKLSRHENRLFDASWAHTRTGLHLLHRLLLLHLQLHLLCLLGLLLLKKQLLMLQLLLLHLLVMHNLLMKHILRLHIFLLHYWLLNTDFLQLWQHLFRLSRRDSASR